MKRSSRAFAVAIAATFALSALVAAADLATEALLGTQAAPLEVEEGDNDFDIKVWLTGNLQGHHTGQATIINKYFMDTAGNIYPSSESADQEVISFAKPLNYDADKDCAGATPPPGCAGNPHIVEALLVVAAGTPPETPGALTVAGDGSQGVAVTTSTWDTGYVEVEGVVDPCASEVAPATPTFQSTNPDGDNGWFVTIPAVSASSATADASIEYSLDQSTWSTTAPILGQGTTTVYARAVHPDCPGLISGAASHEFKVDSVAPTITDNGPTTQPNAAGWYKTDVVNEFVASDATSGIPGSFTPNPFFKTTTGEGSAIEVNSGPVSDVAGNTNPGIDSEAFKIDKTPPTVTVTGFTHEDVFTLGDEPTPGCNTTDALSGVKTHATLSSSGGPVGLVTVTCSGAVDVADNAADPVSATYSVVYAFSSYGPPIAANGFLNNVKAGQTVVFSFRLTDADDDGVQATSAKLGVTAISCSGTLSEEADLAEVSTNGKGLTYLGDGYHRFLWQSPKNLAGGCRTVALDFGDGVWHGENFQFKK